MADEREQRYVIPSNYSNGAKLLGLIKIRNAVEVGVFAGGLAYLEWNLLTLDLYTKLLVIVCTALPVAVVFAIGIDGCSVTEYLTRIFRSVAHSKYYVRKEAIRNVQAQAIYSRCNNAECNNAEQLEAKRERKQKKKK